MQRPRYIYASGGRTRSSKNSLFFANRALSVRPLLTLSADHISLVYLLYVLVYISLNIVEPIIVSCETTTVFEGA